MMVDAPKLDFKIRCGSITVWVQYLRDDTQANDIEWLRKYTTGERFTFIEGAVDMNCLRHKAKEALLQNAEKAIDRILNNVFGE